MFVAVKTPPMSTPNSVKGTIRVAEKCSRAKINALRRTESIVGTYRQSDGIRKPRNSTCTMRECVTSPRRYS